MRGGRRVNAGQQYAKRDGMFFEQALSLLPGQSVYGAFLPGPIGRRWGPFDVSLPACEDYDLWLRTLAAGLPIGLLDEPLAVRHGGRADQLSASCVGQDLFRIRSMLGLLGRDGLSAWHRDCIKRELGRKVAIYVRGCLMHGLAEEAARVRELARSAGVAVAAAPGDGRDGPETSGSRG